MKTLHILIALTVIATLSFASPARGGVMIFTQPDGTTFSGVLRGDSSFHWIECDSQIVLYNSKDKYYYNAVVNSKNKLEFTNRKTKSISLRAAAISASAQINSHRVSKETASTLRKMHQESKKGHHPR